MKKLGDLLFNIVCIVLVNIFSFVAWKQLNSKLILYMATINVFILASLFCYGSILDAQNEFNVDICSNFYDYDITSLKDPFNKGLRFYLPCSDKKDFIKLLKIVADIDLNMI